jgi:hypothetical protein
LALARLPRFAVDVIDPVIVAGARERDRPRGRFGAQLSSAPIDGRRMLSFQKLDVYQRSIECLALARSVTSELPHR